MADEQNLNNPEGQGLDPEPDPWIPPRANYAQAVSIGTGATGALLLGNETLSGPQSLLMLPDPAEIFGRMAHVLGFQLDASSASKLGLVLVILSVLLNLYSFFVRYRFATWVKPRWDAQIAALKRAGAFQQQAATPQAKAKGFVPGEG
ncbi:MAG TPA: hypothetical protein VKM72_28945 [Thermoanaerobaculia bacterium]|nr:hypothetical protein [Thermoanaerobaculia bacterium]